MNDPNYGLPTRRWTAGHIIIALLIFAAGGYWLVQMARKGTFTTDPSGAPTITRTMPAAGDNNVSASSTIAATLSPGHEIDAATIADTVHLLRMSDQQVIPARVEAANGGSDIVLTPMAALEPGTRYTFEIRGAKDADGTELVPYVMSFTTAGQTRSSAD